MASSSAKRVLTNEDVMKYERLVEKFIRDSVVKNWSEAKKSDPDTFLGSSGQSLNDIRQHLRAEICIALQKYNPHYKTAKGLSVKESTFVFKHLNNRIGQMMKRLTKRRLGYGIRHNAIHTLLREDAEERSVLDLDLVLSLDEKAKLKAKAKSQVENFLESKRFR